MATLSIPQSIKEHMMILFSGCKYLKRIEEVVDGVNNNLIDGIAFLDELNEVGRAAYYAHMAHESHGFKYTRELTNYSADTIMRVFPKYVENYKDACMLANDQEQLFNRVYGGRMGNAPDEGYKFIGRGYPQLTGRDNYTRVGAVIEEDLLTDPVIAEDPSIAWSIAYGYYILEQRRLKPALENGDIYASCLIINGGRNGLEDRMNRFNSIRRIMPENFNIGLETRLGSTDLVDRIVQMYLVKVHGYDMKIDGQFGNKSFYFFTRAGYEGRTVTAAQLQAMLNDIASEYN